MDGPAVEGRPTSPGGGEEFVAGGVVENAGDELALAFQSHGDAEDRVTVGEVGGAVQRIDIPAEAAAVGIARALFADDVMLVPRGAQAGDDQLLAGAVGLGDQIDAAFVNRK